MITELKFIFDSFKGVNYPFKESKMNISPLQGTILKFLTNVYFSNLW